ncbi:hypothetical protein AK812_SmicGene9404 [Symbiodinium microadriaticum]|uniref:RRM domain-containing protein n=1 Tax=Symbiodinium microadriaticum TaxID=2951 RepID=A0A1Q9EID0_SYMMI|nr:hypothetical protein AK812_SmicGene9404 [Symbiodinium microadriaticum]
MASPVRFETPAIAEEAAAALDGQDLRGIGVTFTLDPLPSDYQMTLPIPFDGTKIFVDNLEPSVEWQDLKDFCAQVGAVAFVKVDKMPMPAHGAGGLSFGAAFQRGVIATSGANHPTAKIEVHLLIGRLLVDRLIDCVIG